LQDHISAGSSTKKELEIFEEALMRCDELQCNVCKEECKILLSGIRDIVLIRAGYKPKDQERFKYMLLWAEEASRRSGYKFTCEFKFE